MKIKMIVSDMDGTIVSHKTSFFSSSWDVLYESLGLSEENSKLLKTH